MSSGSVGNHLPGLTQTSVHFKNEQKLPCEWHMSRLNSLFALGSTRKPLLTSLQRVQAASETRVFPLSANRFSPSKWCVCACVRACQTDAKRGILRVTQERSCACVWWLNIDVIMHWDRQPLPVWYRHGYNTETRCCKYSYFSVNLTNTCKQATDMRYACTCAITPSSFLFQTHFPECGAQHVWTQSDVECVLEERETHPRLPDILAAVGKWPFRSFTRRHVSGFVCCRIKVSAHQETHQTERAREREDRWRNDDCWI